MFGRHLKLTEDIRKASALDCKTTNTPFYANPHKRDEKNTTGSLTPLLTSSPLRGRGHQSHLHGTRSQHHHRPTPMNTRIHPQQRKLT